MISRHTDTAGALVTELASQIAALDVKFVNVDPTASDIDLLRAQVVAQGRAQLLAQLLAARLLARASAANVG